jgi:hypothetical protein
MTWPMLGWPFPLWIQTSAQFHQQFTWAGMIAGTASCWYATVLHAKDRIWAQPRAPRLGPPAVTRHVTTLLCWFVGAYVLALLPLVVSTVVAGGIGSPDPLVMLSGVLAMVAAVALGYAVGATVPSLVVVPIIPLGFYALRVAGSANGERFAAVSPVLGLDPMLGERESLPLLVFRVALFVAVAIAAARFAGWALSRTALWRGVAYLLVPAALATVALVRPPTTYIADERPPSTCTEQRAIRYCVHVDHSPRLAALVRAVDPVIERFGTKPANVDQVWDQALLPRPVPGVEIAWLEPDGTIATEFATTAAGVYACYDEDDEDVSKVAIDVSHYLRTGVTEDTLSTLSPSEVRRWLARHQTQLQTCTLTADQLPGAQTR